MVSLPRLSFKIDLQDMRMIHSAFDVEGAVEKWVVPVWSLQAAWLWMFFMLGVVDVILGPCGLLVDKFGEYNGLVAR